MFLNISGFEPRITRKLFFNLKGVTLSENERNIFKSLLMSYFIMKQIKSEPEK